MLRKGFRVSVLSETQYCSCEAHNSPGGQRHRSAWRSIKQESLTGRQTAPATLDTEPSFSWAVWWFVLIFYLSSPLLCAWPLALARKVDWNKSSLNDSGRANHFSVCPLCLVSLTWLTLSCGRVQDLWEIYLSSPLSFFGSWNHSASSLQDLL